MLPDSQSRRKVLAIALVGLCVVASGCAGLGLEQGSSETTTEGANAETTASDEEQSANESTTTANESGHSHEGDGHSHDGDGHSGESDENETQTNSSANASTSGKVTVVVDGTKLDLQSKSRADTGGFTISESDPHSWEASGQPTLAAALAQVGVNASADSLSFDGEQYRKSDGANVTYRVDGEPVDPKSYQIEDGDRIWVSVDTGSSDRSTPGTYIKRAQQHVHGSMTFSVDGQSVDFGQEQYQSNDRYFHFEGGDGSRWHAHSPNISVEYALSSLNGINATEDSITYNGTTYQRSDGGTTINVTVNGRPVDVDEYYLKPGDNVEVSIETSGDQ